MPSASEFVMMFSGHRGREVVQLEIRMATLDALSPNQPHWKVMGRECVSQDRKRFSGRGSWST